MAKRFEYEESRQKASEFFTALRSEVDREGSQIRQNRETAEQILAHRDDVITLLAREEESAGERLAYFYFIFRQANASTASPE